MRESSSSAVRCGSVPAPALAKFSAESFWTSRTNSLALRTGSRGLHSSSIGASAICPIGTKSRACTRMFSMVNGRIVNRLGTVTSSRYPSGSERATYSAAIVPEAPTFVSTTNAVFSASERWAAAIRPKM